MLWSSRSHALPRRVGGRAGTRLLVRLAAALERVGQRLALAIPQFSAVARRFAGLLTAFARALRQHAAGLFAGGRGLEERHRGTGDGAKDEGHDDGSGCAVI